MEDQLSVVLQRVGLDLDRILIRKRFLQWRAADRARLNQAAADPALDRGQAAFVERLYDHLAQFTEASALLGPQGSIERLKHSQTQYYRRLLAGPYDRDYVRDRLLVGLVHERAGIDLEWYLGAYRLYLSHMLGQILGESEQVALFDSLLKIVFFDMILAIDTYVAAERQALEDSEARLARALRGTEDGIWDWNVESDRLYVSERWTQMLGLAPLGAGNSRDWFERVHPDDLPALRESISRHLNGETTSLAQEYRIRSWDDSYLWVLVRGVAERDPLGGWHLAGSQTDISARKAAEAGLRHAARHDALTGLANRLHLEELLQAVRRRPRSRESALLFIDLDRFKLINDSLGHNAGDQVLVIVAQRLASCLRAGDHLARFGGDEFVALLGDLACAADAERVAQRMLTALRQPLQLGERTLSVSASIGIAPLMRECATASRSMRCRRPTWPCIARRWRARTSSRCFPTACRSSRPASWSWKARSPRRSHATSSCCTISPSGPLARPHRSWSGPKPCCAGNMMVCWCRRRSSSRRWRNRARSFASATGSCVRPAASCGAGRKKGVRRCTARSTCRSASCSSATSAPCSTASWPRPVPIPVRWCWRSPKPC